MNPPILVYPNFNKEFILYTDASNQGLGAVLCNSNEKPIAYASRTLKTSKLNYATIDKECLGIVWACKHFRPFYKDT